MFGTFLFKDDYILGMMLGTLNRNKQELSARTPADTRRTETETKLHEKLQIERKQFVETVAAEKILKQEKAAAERILKLERAEFEKVRVEEARLAGFVVGVTTHNNQVNAFISTVALPVIYYKPAKHNEKSQAVFDARNLKDLFAFEAKLKATSTITDATKVDSTDSTQETPINAPKDTPTDAMEVDVALRDVTPVTSNQISIFH